jgi:ATP phosphoribosyltransferase, regulatory subunit
MASYKLATPEGTKDYLFNEVTLKNKISNKFRELFYRHSYHEVITPGLEYLDVFLAKGHGQPIEDLYKIVDNHGRLMVLRPDSTTPIARLCATRLKDEILPLRLFYDQNVYAYTKQLRGYSNEVKQAGIELIGSDSSKADLEILYLAVQALEELAPCKFRIEIGHIGIYNSLIEALNVSEDIQEEIRQCIESKNYPALNEQLDKLGSGSEIELIKRLPRLFGENVFEEAENLFQNAKTAETIKYLKGIYEKVKQINTTGNISIDFGIVNRKDYYTGIVFKGYLENFSGEEVLAGGRYDNLLQCFGKKAEAIGFSINVDVVTKVLLNQKHEIRRPNLLLFIEVGYEIQGLSYLKQQRDVYIVEQCLLEDKEAAIAYGKAKNIPCLHIVGEKVECIDLQVRGGQL